MRGELAKSADVLVAHRELEQARAHVADLEAALAKLTNGRADSHEPADTPRPATTATQPEARDLPYSAEVRAWANAQGMSISSRGRIAGDIVNAYLAAH